MLLKNLEITEEIKEKLKNNTHIQMTTKTQWPKTYKMQQKQF